MEIEPFGEVFLHGSRAMAKRSGNLPLLPESTDYDYAAQHTQPWQELVAKAEKEGWVEIVTDSYKDNDTAFVFEKTLEGKKVQVSLRQNLDRYKAVFEDIDPDYYFQYLWKGSVDCLSVEKRREYYNKLYAEYDNKEWDAVFNGKC
jgi:hypothetical protein